MAHSRMETTYRVPTVRGQCENVYSIDHSRVDCELGELSFAHVLHFAIDDKLMLRVIIPVIVELGTGAHEAILGLSEASDLGVDERCLEDDIGVPAGLGCISGALNTTCGLTKIV